jgi:hypothetical protein
VGHASPLAAAGHLAIASRKQYKLDCAQTHARPNRESLLLDHILNQALEPVLWGMVAFTLLMLRLAPLQGWKAAIVAGITAGLVFDTVQFRVGPPRLWDSQVLGSVLAALLAAAVLETLFLLLRRSRAERA